MTKEIQRKLDILDKKFILEDYNLYLDDKITRKELAIKYSCTDYLLCLLFKKRKFLSKNKIRKQLTQDNFFNKIDSPEKAYILGFYIADGSIYNNKLSFTISQKDISILKYIREKVNPKAKIKVIPEYVNKAGIKSNTLVTMQIYSSNIYKTLQDYGIGKNKTYLQKSIKHIVPQNLMWDFIRGYFDGDGCVSASAIYRTIKGKNYANWNVNWTIISHDKNILSEILEFLLSEGIEAILYKETRGNWLVGTHKIKMLKPIYNKLYNENFCLSRKHEKFKQIIANTEVKLTPKK